MDILLIRHTSVDVPQGVCYGQTDVPLRNTFEQEAALVIKKLDGMIFDKAYTSPLTRCVRLASYCGYTNATHDNRLKEIDFGEWEMQKFEEIKDARLQEWYKDYLNIAATGGESFRMLFQRVAYFLDELRQTSYKRVAIFAHGGVLICAQIYAGTVKSEDAFSALSPYGGIVQIKL